jgi:hypothetical protein
MMPTVVVVLASACNVYLVVRVWYQRPDSKALPANTIRMIFDSSRRKKMVSFAKILSAFQINKIQDCHPQAKCDSTCS